MSSTQDDAINNHKERVKRLVGKDPEPHREAPPGYWVVSEGYTGSTTSYGYFLCDCCRRWWISKNASKGEPQDCDFCSGAMGEWYSCEDCENDGGSEPVAPLLLWVAL